MSIDSLKLCKQCDELIAVKARRCPKCHSWQSQRDRFVGDGGWYYLLLAILFFALLIWQGLLLWPQSGADFAQYRDGIEILDIRWESHDEQGEAKIITLGFLKNNTAKKWKDLVLEVQFFDRNDRLVGAYSIRDFNLILVPGEEQAFQVLGVRTVPQDRYYRPRVFVRDAREANRWN